MNLAAVVICVCICVSFASARTEFQSWGNVNATELGRTRVLLSRPVNNKYDFKFTYPDFPNEYPIVGIDLVDTYSPTTVKFINGNIGDKQITIQLTAEGHRIDCYFYFYFNPSNITNA